VCASVFWRPLSPKLAKLRSLRCLLSEAPLTQGYFGDTRLRAGVDTIIARHNPGLAYIFSSAMAPYVARHRGMRVILDLVDVDSEKWRQYARTSTGPARVIYAREGRSLLALERHAASLAEVVILVSRAEAELFSRLAPEAAHRIQVIGNGVDIEHFCPSLSLPTPFGERPAIVFTGLMDYRPNIEAMTWFVAQVMPRLRSRQCPPSLWIVGANPARAVRALAGPDVHVTGRVPDVRPYLRHAAAVVAPLRIGRGIQNKVLEAMAMEAPLVVTPQAREGLDACRDDELVSAESPVGFAAAISRILDGEEPQIGARARARVVRDYRWATSLAALDGLVDPGCQVPASPVRTADAIKASAI
jgi:sugar transferase (PEP-CTERM/EpsH1 system associated)